jgi:hypothetical protein
MSDVDVTITVNGRSIPASEASWMLIAPCGCIAGATVVKRVSKFVLTEKQAWKEFYDGQPGAAEQRTRDQAAGFTVQLADVETIRARLKATCPHEPQWGVQPPPCPEGYTWAGTSDTKRSHLVLGEKDRDARYILGNHPYTVDPLTSLCGKSSSYWSTHWASNADAPTCRACEREASRLLASTS